MLQQINIEPQRTYATKSACEKDLAKRIPSEPSDHLRYMIVRHADTGRFFAVFIGQNALQNGIHFNFPVVG
jgi:hypothetical protein